MNRLAPLLLALSFPSFADDDHDEHHEHDRHHAARSTTPRSPLYERECGACHLAFPPSFLPAPSWTTILGGLDTHFGQDASLDEATRRTLERWLSDNARKGASDAPLKITETRWWKREHHELAPAVFKRSAIGTPANCPACHLRANEGAFGEHEVRIPRDAPAPR